jgi:hypothetical protein
MNRPRTSASGDRALRAFYEFCGLRSDVIEGAIQIRYEEPAIVANRDRAVAELMAKCRRRATSTNEARAK